MKAVIILMLIGAVSAWGWGEKFKTGEGKMQADSPRDRPSGSSHHFYYGDVHHHHEGHDHSSSHESKSSEEDDDEEKPIYYFCVGDDFGPYEHISPETGRITGFHIDLMNALCDEADLKCYYVMDRYANCWETEGDVEFPGKGLLDDYYSACIGYWPYPRRFNSFNFTLSFAKADNANAFWLKSRNDEFKEDDVKGLKIGFISGWSVSKQCLARETGNDVNDFTSVFFESYKDMVVALRDQKIDLMLGSRDTFVAPDDIHVGSSFDCSWNNRGPAFMLKVGNPLIKKLNKALSNIIDDGSYGKLCEEANKQYSSRGEIRCLD
ncbi:unnamed protein product [Owenia fusiformis]|uniref:Solute-binding protein family 3/N-terminal domain-containing protein n=1 Tax=Owenia fusiformis TaxID=6347 RepID=A0A8S4NDD6_OWEFU|nr:unnamed protein product [Owenia fusiformis]